MQSIQSAFDMIFDVPSGVDGGVFLMSIALAVLMTFFFVASVALCLYAFKAARAAAAARKTAEDVLSQARIYATETKRLSAKMNEQAGQFEAQTRELHAALIERKAAVDEPEPANPSGGRPSDAD